jgi:hypothetical protein
MKLRSRPASENAEQLPSEVAAIIIALAKEQARRDHYAQNGEAAGEASRRTA